MRVSIVFVAVALFSVAESSSRYGPSRLGGLIAGETGSSSQYRSQDSSGNYQFGYDEQHNSGGSFRRESSGPDGAVTGSYGITDADGRHRIVHYIADASGFHARIQTNEPGIEASDPAGVSINKGVPVAVVPPPRSVPLALAPIPAPRHLTQVQRTVDFGPASVAPIAPVASSAPPAPVAPVAPIGIKQSHHHAIKSAPIHLASPIRFQPAPQPVVTNTWIEPVSQQQVIEEPTPSAFSYSFTSTHHQVPLISEPIHQQQLVQDY